MEFLFDGRGFFCSLVPWLPMGFRGLHDLPGEIRFGSSDMWVATCGIFWDDEMKIMKIFKTIVGQMATWQSSLKSDSLPLGKLHFQAMNVIGTSVMVKIGQLVPFRPAYIASLTLQMIMILAMPMLAFWSPEKVSERDMGIGSECVNMCMTRRSDGQDSTCTVNAGVQHPLHGFQQLWSSG